MYVIKETYSEGLVWLASDNEYLISEDVLTTLALMPEMETVPEQLVLQVQEGKVTTLPRTVTMPQEEPEPVGQAGWAMVRAVVVVMRARMNFMIAVLVSVI